MMSIKSRTPGIASDMPLMAKQRGPAYTAKVKDKPVPPIEDVDNISDYVDKNLSKVDKRHTEYR